MRFSSAMLHSASSYYSEELGWDDLDFDALMPIDSETTSDPECAITPRGWDFLAHNCTHGCHGDFAVMNFHGFFDEIFMIFR